MPNIIKSSCLLLQNEKGGTTHWTDASLIAGASGIHSLKQRHHPRFLAFSLELLCSFLLQFDLHALSFPLIVSCST